MKLAACEVHLEPGRYSLMEAGMYAADQVRKRYFQYPFLVILLLPIITIPPHVSIHSPTLQQPPALMHKIKSGRSQSIQNYGHNDYLTTFLPIVLKTLPRYAVACGLSNNFCEPNNAPDSAYGPLAKTQSYSAFPEDSYDYYYVTLPVKGGLKAELSGYNATGNLLIYRSSDTTNPIANWGQGGANMTLNLSNLEPGNYFILVYTSTGFNTSATYTLKATY